MSYGNESEKILETIFGNKDQIRHLESESSSEQIQKIKVEREDFYEQDVESRHSMPEENEFNHEVLDHSTVSFLIDTNLRKTFCFHWFIFYFF